MASFLPHQSFRQLAFIALPGKTLADLPLDDGELMCFTHANMAKEACNCGLLSELHEAAVQRLRCGPMMKPTAARIDASSTLMSRQVTNLCRAKPRLPRKQRCEQ